MKNRKNLITICLILISLITVSCYNQTSNNDKPTNKKEKISNEDFMLQLDETEFNFGEINMQEKQNELISKEFTLINNNNQPIIITKADVSCGCISVEIPTKPILKGEKGGVKVIVNTKQLNGHFRKQIFLSSNANNGLEVLTVTGEIKK